MQGSNTNKAATAPPAMNVTRTIEGVARSTSAHQPVTIAQQSSIARDASHSNSPSSSHDTPQVNNDSNTEERGGNSSHAALHSVGQVNVHNAAADEEDDASSLSETEGDNAKSERILQQYFASLAQSGTIRTVTEEKDLITSKLGIIFKRIKFLDSNSNLISQGNIAKVLYKEMRVQESFRNIWWEQMKRHVWKKLDERRSNCGSTIKKLIISKLIMDTVFLHDTNIFVIAHSQCL